MVRVAGTFRVHVDQFPHLRDQLCQVIDVDEGTMPMAMRKLCHWSTNSKSFYKPLTGRTNNIQK